MKSAFRKSFARDLKKIKDRSILDGVRRIIEEVEAASDLLAIGGLKNEWDRTILSHPAW